jgi:hypothetical protein
MKKPRKSYSIKKKLEIVNEFKSSKNSLSNFAQKKNIAVSNLSKWLKDEKIKKIEENLTSPFPTQPKKILKKRKIGNSGKTKKMLSFCSELDFYLFLKNLIELGIPSLNSKTVCNQAKEMFPTSKCRFSAGWWKRFKSRWNLFDETFEVENNFNFNNEDEEEDEEEEHDEVLLDKNGFYFLIFFLF